MSLAPPSLQWSLDNSAQSVVSVAKGALQAATSDNVQLLAILSCERFGNTIAMSPDTRRKMEHSVVPTPPPAVLGFLQATVGHSPETIKVTVHSSIEAPSELVSTTFNPNFGVGMIGIDTYGHLLLDKRQFKQRTAVLARQQALPYALRQALQNLVVWGYGALDGSPLEFWKLVGSTEKEPVSLAPTEFKLSPFPSEEIIGKLCAVLCGLPEPPEFRNLDSDLLISDLPLVRLHLEYLAKRCSCFECNPPHGDKRECYKTRFLNHIANLVADILVLSLFQSPGLLLVQYGSTDDLRLHSHFTEVIHTLIQRGGTHCCALGYVLEWALQLVGHETKYTSGWIISSDHGQAVWPTIYGTRNYEKKGFLSLSWAPGTIWYRNASHKICFSTDTTFATDDSETYVHGVVSEPCDLYPTLKLQWQVTLHEEGLQVSVGLKGKHGTLKVSQSPAYILENLANAMLVERCKHSPNDKLDVLDRFSFLAGPFSPFDPQASDEKIGVVAVDGRDDLRLMALCGKFPRDKFVVLRKGACLSCCLQTCREVGAGAIVL
ncbi:hypothetical protein NM208_g13025 [Fusarium decemcellulare]|uniref:Uncharacterized protein n=1 Tax=Fusarium decemcellulare TaxID=57161 RepID=A0ACC1RPX9_9HYPO|nr:hypothetical protein NM208_g13025 [Fusarium decemcellulare]